MNKELFISCPENLEPLLLEELKQLNVPSARKGFRGVSVPASMEAVYTINYCSRIATRVLYPLRSFTCRGRDDLYDAAREIPWNHFFKGTQTLAIDANVSHPRLKHSLFAAQVMKDAICDQLREKTGERPSIDLKNPDIQLNLYIQENKALISFDTSGAPLFKRGWRSASTTASLQENLAAALLMRAGYTANKTLCDPFCGSGTFLIEAALMATCTPPGFFRKKWGFMQLPEFNAERWNAFKATWDARRISLAPNKLFGADKDLMAIQASRGHARATGFLDEIQFQQADIIRYSPPTPIDLVITDPPYGKRLETSQQLYRELGQFLQKIHPSSAWVLAPHAQYLQVTDLPIKRAFPFFHGGMDVSAFQL